MNEPETIRGAADLEAEASGPLGKAKGVVASGDGRGVAAPLAERGDARDGASARDGAGVGGADRRGSAAGDGSSPPSEMRKRPWMDCGRASASPRISWVSSASISASISSSISACISSSASMSDSISASISASISESISASSSTSISSASSRASSASISSRALFAARPSCLWRAGVSPRRSHSTPRASKTWISASASSSAATRCFGELGKRTCWLGLAAGEARGGMPSSASHSPSSHSPSSHSPSPSSCAHSSSALSCAHCVERRSVPR